MGLMDEIEQCLAFQHSAFQCPIQFVVDLIGNKWTILVLRELFASDGHRPTFGHRRTHELLAALPDISTKMLTQRLRELEHHGLIERRVYAEVPPHVEYSLTAKGRQIQPVMMALHEVGSKWLDQEPCICPMEQHQPIDREGASTL
jgi:DNA-binding HxlR family transcriptional regulator